MYFLDPEEWKNLDELEKHYADMTEELAKELRDKIAPYMLRRRKEDVLDLPPKVSQLIRYRWIVRSLNLIALLNIERNHRTVDNATFATKRVQVDLGEECRSHASIGSSHDPRGSSTQSEGVSQYLDAVEEVSHYRRHVPGVQLTSTLFVRCLQHPFLNTPELEDRTLGSKETHQALIDASGKLTFLRTLLPKLKAKGHRILLFSQVCLASKS